MCFVLRFIRRGVRDDHTLLPGEGAPDVNRVLLGLLEVILDGALRSSCVVCWIISCWPSINWCSAS
jgi:hypothetical protein